MRVFFSKRHEKALIAKKLQPSIPLRLRVAIGRTLNDYSKWGGFDNQENYTFQNVEEVLKTFYGEHSLYAYDSRGELIPTDLNGLVERGYPARVFDVIEAWCEYAEPPDVAKFERELNSIFEIHNSPWRILNSTIILIDSEYLHDEVVQETQNLLLENSMAGAQEEFTEALSCLTDNRMKEAVINAHKSVESVMKIILKTDKPLTFKRLLDELIKSGIIPIYYTEFMSNFRELALGVVKERNRPGASHGQGSEIQEIPKCLAEFVVHLAAVINVFLIKQWIGSRPEPTEDGLETECPF